MGRAFKVMKYYLCLQLNSWAVVKSLHNYRKPHDRVEIFIIYIFYLKVLVRTASCCLTKVPNLSLITLMIFDMWKLDSVVQLLKSRKPGNNNKAGSYLPISFLSPVTKMIGALLLPSFTHHRSQLYISMAFIKCTIPQLYQNS